MDNPRCVATYMYVGNASDSGSSSTLLLVVNGLDVCRYSYSVMGHVITAIVTFPEIDRVHHPSASPGTSQVCRVSSQSLGGGLLRAPQIVGHAHFVDHTRIIC